MRSRPTTPVLRHKRVIRSPCYITAPSFPFLNSFPSLVFRKTRNTFERMRRPGSPKSLGCPSVPTWSCKPQPQPRAWTPVTPFEGYRAKRCVQRKPASTKRRYHVKRQNKVRHCTGRHRRRGAEPEISRMADGTMASPCTVLQLGVTYLCTASGGIARGDIAPSCCRAVAETPPISPVRPSSEELAQSELQMRLPRPSPSALSPSAMHPRRREGTGFLHGHVLPGLTIY